MTTHSLGSTMRTMINATENAPDSWRERFFASPVTRGACLVGGFALVVFVITRLVLLLTLARHAVAWDGSLAKAITVGLGYDFLAAFYVSMVWVVLSSLVASGPLGKWRLLLLVGLVALVAKGLAGQGVIAISIVSAILALPVLCTFGQRSGRIFTTVVVALFVVALLFGAVAEWFFWEEFGVRFNFVAVDYLVYTQEVFANINESYPMPVIVSALLGTAALIVWWFQRRGWLERISAAPFNWQRRFAPLTALLAMFVATIWAWSQSQLPKFDNNYNAELAKNGLYSFGAAFWENEIPFSLYPNHPIEVALASAQKHLTTAQSPPASNIPGDMRRLIQHQGEERKWNVFLICVESLSGEYVGALGSKRGLTPNLDRMAKEGMFFSNLYATGTRTVRGMEAITMSVPPTPGQSLLRRPECTDMFSLGSLFASRGYDNAFLYGGNGLFDNMNYFFRNNYYRIVDRPQKEKSDVTFENAWGACDGDMFRWAMEEADRDHAVGKPFHFFCMTTSNHRPFTFPLTGVDLKDSAGKELTDGPKRTVKYTDYAINELIQKAQTKPWFANTVFVIIADHCAFSAGKAELDITKFHIPALIWNPRLVQPQRFTTLASQIDVMPTLFGLMNWNYTSRFFGLDVLDPEYTGKARAYISNYQKVGYLRGENFAILKPKKEFSLYDVNRKTGDLTPNPTLTPLLDEAIDLYQSAAHLYKAGRLRSDISQP
jgi:phosphoglycerol transferase MdoB-like AlkP superfamily enzyme